MARAALSPDFLEIRISASCLLFFFALLCSFAFLSAYQSEHLHDHFIGLVLIAATSGHLAFPFTWPTDLLNRLNEHHSNPPAWPKRSSRLLLSLTFSQVK